MPATDARPETRSLVALNPHGRSRAEALHIRKNEKLSINPNLHDCLARESVLDFTCSSVEAERRKMSAVCIGARLSEKPTRLLRHVMGSWKGLN
jgi:hypothetical protein